MPFRHFYNVKQRDGETVTYYFHALFEELIEHQTTKDIQVMSNTLLKEHLVEQLSDNLIRRLAKNTF